MATVAPVPPYPVRVEVDYPERSSRLLALAALLFAIKGLLLIPHGIVLWFVGMVAGIAAWLGWLVVLITGNYPKGLFDFQVGVLRWQTRVSAWFLGLTDQYPPFRLYD